jgi:hypothetical protein
VTASTFELYIPCDVIGVDIEVAPEEHLSKLEALALRAVAAGCHHLKDLEELFGLGTRPTLDLVYDLWRNDYLKVDIWEGSFQLSEDARRQIKDGKLEELASAEATEEPMELLVDRVTATVLPVRVGRNRMPPSRKIAPADRNDVGLQDISTASLLEALRRLTDDETKNGEERTRGRKVLSARLALPQDGKAQRCWLPVQATCGADPRSGRIRVTVTEGPFLTALAKRRFGERLTVLVEEQPDSPFARWLREHAAEAGAEFAAPLDMADALDELDRLLADPAETDPDRWRERHWRLDRLAGMLEEECRERHEAEVEVEALPAGAQLDAIVRLVDVANSQVILACPLIHSRDLARILPRLQEALRRNVQVFLLWGSRDDATLTQQVQNDVTALQAQFPNRFFCGRRPSRSSASIVIQDDRRVLCTSQRYLASPDLTALDFGVLLTAPESGPHSRPIEDLLSWARATFPERDPAQRMRVVRDGFEPSAPRAALDLKRRDDGSDPAGLLAADGLHGRRPHLPALVGKPPGQVSDELAQPTARTWLRKWREHAAALRAELERHDRTTVAVLLRGDHRDALWEGLRRAEQRLLIASEALSIEAVDASVLHQLENRLQAGVFVALVHQRQWASTGAHTVELEQRLAALENAYPDRFRWVRSERRPVFAKAIVWDDVAVASSFSFLRHEEEPAGTSRRRQPSAVGVKLAGRDAAEAVARVFRVTFPEQLGSFPETAPPPASGSTAAPPEAPQAAAQAGEGDLQALLDEVAAHHGDPAACARAIRQRFAQTDDSWLLIDRLDQAGLPAWLLRIAAAACLVQAEALDQPLPAPTPSAAARWMGWLAEYAWERGDFVEAAVLCAAIPADLVARSRLPSEPVVRLAAVRGDPSFAATLTAALAARDLPAGERLAVVVGGIGELLLHGAQDIETLAPHLRSFPDPWRRMGQAAEEYWRAAWRPLPVDSIRAELDSAAHQADARQRWERLRAALTALATGKKMIPLGDRTRDRLCHRDEPVGQLAHFVAEQDPEGVAAWLQEHPVGQIQAVLTAAAAAVIGPGGRPLDGTLRNAFVKQLQRVWAAAADVAPIAPAAAAVKDPTLMAATRQLAAALAAIWQDLEVAVASTADPARRLLAVVLDQLRDVKEWESR